MVRHAFDFAKRITAQFIPLWMLMLLTALVSCLPGAQPAAPAPAAAPSEMLLRVSGSGTALPLAQKLAEAYSQAHPGVRFQFDAGTNTGGAIRGVLEGTLDLAVGNRPLSRSEAKEPLVYQPFAWDAVVFAVNLPNPVQGLSAAQIRDIYGGSLTNWQALGGPAEPIIVLDRDEDESARKLVLLPLLGGRSVRARTAILTSAREMVVALENTPNALGYSSLGLLRLMQVQRVRVLALDGVMPSAESLSQGAYPWYLTFGLIYRRDAPPFVRGLVDWAQAPAGRSVLKAYGYAPLEP